MPVAEANLNIWMKNGDDPADLMTISSVTSACTLYSCSRRKLPSLKTEMGRIKKEGGDTSGVYILLSSNQVYVGQAKSHATRLSEHNTKAEGWWSKTLCVTRSGGFNTAQLNYVERKLIERCRSGRLSCKNELKGNSDRIDRNTAAEMDRVVDELRVRLAVLGVDCLEPADGEPAPKMGKDKAIETMRGAGVHCDRGNTSYTSNGRIDIKLESLSARRYLILQRSQTLVLLDIPPGALGTPKKPKKGIQTRQKNGATYAMLDLGNDGLVDRRSGIDLGELARVRSVGTAPRASTQYIDCCLDSLEPPEGSP